MEGDEEGSLHSRRRENQVITMNLLCDDEVIGGNIGCPKRMRIQGGDTGYKNTHLMWYTPVPVPVFSMRHSPAPRVEGPCMLMILPTWRLSTFHSELLKVMDTSRPSKLGEQVDWRTKGEAKAGARASKKTKAALNISSVEY